MGEKETALELRHEEIGELLGVARRTVGYRLDQFRTLARAADITLPEAA